jgi:hypothetical protein
MSRMLTHIEQAVVKIGDTGASASQQMGMQMEGLLQGNYRTNRVFIK